MPREKSSQKFVSYVKKVNKLEYSKNLSSTSWLDVSLVLRFLSFYIYMYIYIYIYVYIPTNYITYFIQEVVGLTFQPNFFSYSSLFRAFLCSSVVFCLGLSPCVHCNSSSVFLLISLTVIYVQRKTRNYVIFTDRVSKRSKLGFARNILQIIFPHLFQDFFVFDTIDSSYP